MTQSYEPTQNAAKEDCKKKALVLDLLKDIGIILFDCYNHCPVVKLTVVINNLNA